MGNLQVDLTHHMVYTSGLVTQSCSLRSKLSDVMRALTSAPPILLRQSQKLQGGTLLPQNSDKYIIHPTPRKLTNISNGLLPLFG